MSTNKFRSFSHFCPRFLSVFSLIGLSAHFSVSAQESAPADSSLSKPAALVAPAAAPEDEKLNPTLDVAGGVGKQGIKPPKYAVLPTGKTLPAGIFRVVYTAANTFGDFGFDKHQTRYDSGVTYDRWMSGVKVEYGLNKRVSFAIGVPYVMNNVASVDGNTFQGTDFYKKYFNRFADKLAPLGLALNRCNSIAACKADIESGDLVLPVSVPIYLPTGETQVIRSGRSVKSQIQDVILAAARPSNGANGVGDIELGLLYNIVSEDSPIRHVPLYFSLGAGFRLPTGRFDLPAALRTTGGDNTLPTGGGTFDALLRWNLDYVALPGWILSWQHRMGLSLTKANLGRVSMKNPNEKNTANPFNSNASVARGSGDLVDNALTYSRKGIHHVGFLQTAWGVGNVNESFKWLGLYAQAKYNIAAASYLNDMPVYALGDQFYLQDPSMHADHGYEQYYAAVVGTKFSGLPYMIPVELNFEFEYPFAGKNRIVSPMNAKGELSLYF